MILGVMLYPLSPTLEEFAELTIIRSHRSTTYVDAVYCYRPGSMVCRSVCRSVCLSSDVSKLFDDVKEFDHYGRPM